MHIADAKLLAAHAINCLYVQTFPSEEGMIYMLLYTHLCHYRGGDFGKTYSLISCHLFINCMLMGLLTLLVKFFV